MACLCITYEWICGLPTVSIGKPTNSSGQEIIGFLENGIGCLPPKTLMSFCVSSDKIKLS